MSVTSEATTTWSGGLFEGGGSVALESSNQGPFAVNWKARSEGSTSVTTPEELLAAAHSSCFSMALSHALTENGTPPSSVETTASVTFVPGLSAEDFARIADDAKRDCPVSQALAGVEITLEASLA